MKTDRARIHALIDIMLDDEVPLTAKHVVGLRLQSGGGPGVYFIMFSCPPELNEEMHAIGRMFAQAIPAVLRENPDVAKVINFGTPGRQRLDEMIEEKLKNQGPSVN